VRFGRPSGEPERCGHRLRPDGVFVDADPDPMNIWEAAKDGDLGELQRLVGHDPGLLDEKSLGGWTPLMHASQAGHVDVVQWLLDWGAAINESANDGMTPLYLACHKGHSPVVRLLLESGADPFSSAGKEIGCTPLMTACARGHVEVVRWMLGHSSAKANINHRNVFGAPALSHACNYGRAEVVRALLESGADPTIASHRGDTPMDFAKGADPYPEGVTAADRQECVVALEVRFGTLIPPRRPILS
jgi:ankyrin repeat protein